MKNSGKEITAAAGASTADSEDWQFEPRRVDPAQSRTDSTSPQPDRLAEKFEAALAAALRGDLSKRAQSNQPAISVCDSSDPGQPDEEPFCDNAASDWADAKDRRALMDEDQADWSDAVAPVSSPIGTCAALRPPRLALASRTSAEPGGNSLPVTMHLAQPAGETEEDSLEWSRERRSPEHGSLLAEHPPDAILAVPQEEGDRVTQDRSCEPARSGDPVDLREKTLLGFVALWHRRWEGNPIHRGVLPVAILAGLAGLGAVLLMPVIAPGSPPTKTVAEDGATKDPSANGAPGREPNDQRWELSEDMVERDTAEHVPQEPITPKLVKTVRITGSSDQSTNFLPRADLPPLEAADGISSEGTGASAIVSTDAELSSSRQTGIDASGREWSESAVQSASPAERVEFGERASAAGDEALVESEPQVAEPDRWPTSIPFEDIGQSTDRTSAASETDELALPNSEPAPRAADTGNETAAAEAEDTAGSDPVEASPSPEPTRFASVTADVNMRAGPGNDAPVLTVIPAGRRVGVIACSAWCEVTMEGERGWVHRDLVAGEARSGPGRADLAGDRIAAGMPLISADGTQIGTIRNQSIDSTGQEFVVIDLAQELGAAVPSIRLKAEYIAAKDEQARINVTRARLLSSLPSKSGSAASAITGAN